MAACLYKKELGALLLCLMNDALHFGGARNVMRELGGA